MKKVTNPTKQAHTAYEEEKSAVSARNIQFQDLTKKFITLSKFRSPLQKQMSADMLIDTNIPYI